MRKHSLTTWSLVALALALALGIWGHINGAAAVATLDAILKPLAAIVGAPANESVGKLGLRTVLLFVVMLLAAGVFTLVIAPPLVALYDADPATIASLRSTV